MDDLDGLLASLSDALEISPVSVQLLREWERVWRLLVEADSSGPAVPAS
jgi:hypothetical protein